MVNLRIGRYVFPALLLAATANAQSRPGFSCDQTIRRVITSAGRTDSSTSVVHMTRAGGDVRIDTREGQPSPTIGAFSPGAHSVVIMREGLSQVLYLNPDQKQYLSFKPWEMMKHVQKMMESMGGSMVFDTAGSRVNIDSLGPGPTIDGHPTLAYRLTTSTRVTMTMMGEQQRVDSRAIFDFQVATDMAEFTDMNPGLTGLAEASQAMGMPKGYYDKIIAMRQQIHGVALRAVTNTTSTVRGIPRSATETIETRNIKRIAVPDSVFAIPADYKAVKAPAIPTGT